MPSTRPPRIGIAVGLDAEGQLRPGRRTHYLDAAYADAVIEAGGVPLLLGCAGPRAPLLHELDGLLFPGGDDFPPERAYPEAVRFRLASREQRDADRTLLALALERGLPVLGICYGMQLLALQLGGRLHHHLPLDLPDAGPHQGEDGDARHDVRIVAGTRLAEALGAGGCRVNSRHHQAVAEPGPVLGVSARAEDGVIEAIEGRGRDWVVGVQWHPEGMEEDHRRALFGAFVARCRG